MSLNKKAEWQPWSERDFQSDTDVRYNLNWLQKLLYKQLCNSAWDCSTRPDLPDDDEQLWKLAGCEDREMWEQNKEVIRKMFQAEDGVLFRNRIRKDWDRVVGYRENQVARGRAGAEARWSSPKQSNPLDVIPRLSAKILGKSQHGQSYRKELKDLTEIYGGNAVIEGFEKWARSQSNPPDYPISAFCKKADHYINLEPEEGHPDLDSLAQKLLEIGGQAFTADKRAGLLTLLESYTSEEIQLAYKDFVATKDDFSIKFAPRDFVQGGAKDFIETIRTRKQKEQDVQHLISKRQEEARRDVEQKLKKLESEEIEERL